MEHPPCLTGFFPCKTYNVCIPIYIYIYIYTSLNWGPQPWLSPSSPCRGLGSRQRLIGILYANDGFGTGDILYYINIYSDLSWYRYLVVTTLVFYDIFILQMHIYYMDTV